MSRFPSIGLLAGLFCSGAAASLGFAAGQTAQTPVPNFSSVDLPWMNGGAGFLPPPTGPGPVTTDKAHPVMARNPNNRGEVVEAPLRLADLSNPNLTAALCAIWPAILVEIGHERRSYQIVYECETTLLNCNSA